MSELPIELSVCKLASSCCWAQEQRIMALLLSLDWQYDAAQCAAAGGLFAAVWLRDCT